MATSSQCDIILMMSEGKSCGLDCHATIIGPSMPHGLLVEIKDYKHIDNICPQSVMDCRTLNIIPMNSKCFVTKEMINNLYKNVIFISL